MDPKTIQFPTLEDPQLSTLILLSFSKKSAFITPVAGIRRLSFLKFQTSTEIISHPNQKSVWTRYLILQLVKNDNNSSHDRPDYHR